MSFRDFNRSSLFTEVLSKPELALFNLAYSVHNVPVKKNTPRHIDRQLPAARRWVRDVMTIFADQLGITPAQATQMFESGDQFAIRRIYARRSAKLSLAITEYERGASFAVAAYAELAKPIYTQVAEWDVADINVFVRKGWVHALSIKEPPMLQLMIQSVRRAEAAAEEKRRADAAAKRAEMLAKSKVKRPKMKGKHAKKTAATADKMSA